MIEHNINELTDEQKLHTLHALLLWYQCECQKTTSTDDAIHDELAGIIPYVLADALAGGVQ